MEYENMKDVPRKPVIPSIDDSIINSARVAAAKYQDMIDVLRKPVIPSIDDSIINSARAAAAKYQDMIDVLRKPVIPSIDDSIINSARAAGVEYQHLIDVLRKPVIPSIDDSIINSARAAAAKYQDMIDVLRKPVIPSIDDSIINSARAAGVEYQHLIDVLRRPVSQSHREVVAKPLQKSDKSESRPKGKTHKFVSEPDTKMTAEILNGISINRVIANAVLELSKDIPLEAETQYVNAVNDLVENLPKFSQNSSSRALHDYVSKVPKNAQFILWVLITLVIYPYIKSVLDDIAVSLTNDNLKPIIKAYICEQPWATNKVISTLICETPEGRLSSNRFVNADYLYVRKIPNQKGEVVDLLPRFEPVTLIRKNENYSWSLIRYKNNDGEIMEGWVFSRYLYKPKL